MRFLSHTARLGLCVGPLLAATACNSLRHRTDTCNDTECHAIVEPLLCKDPTMKALAHDLDHLESHIDWYGSVTAKVPDIWGQARLTQYREDFEDQMKLQLTAFSVKINGSLARSDQAFLAYAETLGIAASANKSAGNGRSASATAIAPPPATPPVAPELETTQRTVQTVFTSPDGATKSTVNDTLSPPTPPTSLKAPSAGEVGKLTSLVTEDKVVKRSDATLNASPAGLSLEPTIELAQRKRYLDYLNQLRRENEGDDTADSPGYSLNLMRIPVSVLPGKRTDVGFGAEVTMSLRPILGEELLPTTFRKFVANDLTTQLGFPLTLVLNDTGADGLSDTFNAEFRTFVRLVTQLIDYVSFQQIDRAKALAYHISVTPAELKIFNEFATDEMKASFKDLLNEPKQAYAQSGTKKYSFTDKKQSSVFTQEKRKSFPTKFNVPALSFSNGVNNRIPFPTSQLVDVYGEHAMVEIATGASEALEKATKRQGYAHLPDVQAYLREELTGAHEFLAKNPGLLERHCTAELVQAIRSRRIDEVWQLRIAYRRDVSSITHTEPADITQIGKIEPQHLYRTPALAWCVIVDSALMTDRLMRDMHEVAAAKGKGLPMCEGWKDYYHPTPSAEARAAFRSYVELRWPIHVFSLDPAIQEQNIVDSMSTRREMQLAISVAFTQGAISSNRMLQFSRRLEADYQTIALNRTQVGFSHGENTFGWRFYPRFQTPDTESNLTVILRDQIIGGPNRNALLRQRRLEPGPRECVAIVMMPSFVPYVELDTVSNWFPLTNPKHKVLDHSQALKLSRTVQTLKTDGCGVVDADKYREGDFVRLQRRVEQLETRLPMQTMTTQVPILNTLGGFEMFSNGTTDLAPELYGWYGAPGVSATQATMLFIVGDHFSPLRTQVVVGNMPATVKLLSRQVAQVTVPAGVVPFYDTERKQYFVQANVATPYGVTRELLIPIVGVAPPAVAAAPPTSGYTLDPGTLKIKYKLVPSEEAGKFRLNPVGIGDQELNVKWTDGLGHAPKAITLAWTFKFKTHSKTVPITAKVPVTGTKNGYVFDNITLTNVIADLFTVVNTAGPFAADAVPLSEIASVKVTISPVDDGVHTLAPKVANNELLLEFVGEIVPEAPVVIVPQPTVKPMPAAKK